MQIYSTQAFTENCIVCRSHRSDVGFEAGVDDVPEVLLAGPIKNTYKMHLEETKKYISSNDVLQKIGHFSIYSKFSKKFIPELRCLGWLLEVVDDEDEGCAGDGLAGWDELLVVIGSTTRPGS